MLDFLDELLKRRGINDFDELREDEKQEYFKLLEIAEKSVVTLEDVKKHIKAMMDAVQFALATEKLSKEEDLMLKARLKNYLFFDNLLNRPERARYMLEQYGKQTRG